MSRQNPFVNRIVGYTEKKASDLLANPSNWRKHPQRQREAVQASLRELGWIAPVIENVRTGYLVDGHERVWQALQKDESVPVLQVDLSEDEEKLALAIFDPITGMAETDDEFLDKLLKEVQTSEDAIREMLSGMQEDIDLHKQAPSLYDLHGQYGEPGDRDFWPVIRAQVSPDTMRRWNELLDMIDAEDEPDKVEILLGAVDENLLSDVAPKKQIEQTLGQVIAQERAMKIHLAEHDPQHLLWANQGVDKENMRVYLVDTKDPQKYGYAQQGAIKGDMKLRILLSYHYYKDVDLDALFAKYFPGNYPDVFADSGAYSAMTQGAPIAIDEYAAWIKRWQHLFTVYANLDVIMCPEETWHNQQYLEDKHDLAPLPAFHVRENFSWLELYAERYPYIGLGVAGIRDRKPQLMAWLTKCYMMVEGRSVFHGFALTSWQVMSSFPWYSVDSSTWGVGFRFGTVPLFDDKNGILKKLKLGDGPTWAKYAPIVRAMGFSPSDFADRKRNDRATICAISALSFMRAEQWLRKRWGEIRIPERQDADPGMKVYLVAGSSGMDTPRGGNMSVKALSESGLNIYLAETTNEMKDIRSAVDGIEERCTQ